MQKTINKIENNYKTEIKKTIEYLKTKGFILDENNTIYKFNIFTKQFKEIDINNFYKYVFSNMDHINNWNYPLEQSQEFINDFLLIENKILPIVETSTIKEFELYKQAQNYLNNPQNIFSKRDLNKQLKRNNQLKKAFKFDTNNINSQIQLLINNNIFYDDLKQFYRYDDKTNLFIHYDLNALIKLFKSKSNYPDYYLKEIITENTLFYIQGLININAIKWNKQQNSENNLIKYKSSYKTIKNIIKTFE